jgi:hypothetical protein
METLGNDSISVGRDGGLYQHLPCQAMNNVTYVSFDASKRDTVAFPNNNEFQFNIPNKRGIFSIALVEFQYPYFAAVVADQYFNLIVEELGVMNEGSSSSSPSGNNAIVSSITFQAPLFEIQTGLGWCLWRWEDGGQRPIKYFPRTNKTGFRVRLVDKTGALITTGLAPGAAGPTLRLVFAIESKN